MAKKADTRRIAPLDEVDFEVAEGDPDVRGWGVWGKDGRRVGEVEELIVDTAARRVRYLDIELDDKLTGMSNRRVLVPIGAAQLEPDHSEVRLQYESDDIVRLPVYTAEGLTRDYEEDLRRGFDPEYKSAEGDEFYQHDLYNDRRFYGRTDI